MLWRVKNSGLTILGSVHVLDVPPLPLAHGQAEYAAAARVLFEHDLTQVPDMRFAQLKPGETLNSLIPTALYTAVEKRCREWSLSLENFSHLQPWLVALALSVKTAELAGLLAGNGVDLNLLRVARTQGKTIEFLEDAAGALKNFANAPLVEQVKMLSLAAQDLPTGIDFFRRLIGGWKVGRADLVWACAQERVAQMPTMFGSLIEGRNLLWLPRLLGLAKSSESTFMVVGVLHMVGPTGVPALLRQSGCEVVPVDVTGE